MGCWWKDGDGGGKVARGRWNFWSSPQLLTCCHPSQLLAASDLSCDLVTAQPSHFVPSPSDYPFGHLTSAERPSYLWVAAHLSDFVPCWLALAQWPRPVSEWVRSGLRESCWVGAHLWPSAQTAGGETAWLLLSNEDVDNILSKKFKPYSSHILDIYFEKLGFTSTFGQTC